MNSRLMRLLGAFGLAGLVLGGCASDRTVSLLHQKPIPPVYVARATNGPYWQNVTLQAVEGTPEFRWFDGGTLLTTRPTRKQAREVFVQDLDGVGMLAPDRIQGKYMLYVKFEDLHGPDFIPFTNKHASAAITFRLVDWRSGEVVKTKRVIAAYEADGAATAEEVRYVLFVPFFGPIALANNYAFPPADEGADLVFHYVIDERAPVSEVAEIQPVDWRFFPALWMPRRIAAWHGLLNLAFDEFINELSADGSVQYKEAVSCEQLNGFQPRDAAMLETANAYAVDCPGSNYMVSIVHRLYPKQF
jgi:hypothetical protein